MTQLVKAADSFSLSFALKKEVVKDKKEEGRERCNQLSEGVHPVWVDHSTTIIYYCCLAKCYVFLVTSQSSWDTICCAFFYTLVLIFIFIEYFIEFYLIFLIIVIFLFSGNQIKKRNKSMKIRKKI